MFQDQQNVTFLIVSHVGDLILSNVKDVEKDLLKCITDVSKTLVDLTDVKKTNVLIKMIRY